MSKPAMISSVLRTFTADKFVSLAEQAERLAQVNIRLAKNEAAVRRAKAESLAREQAAISSLGRGEYLSLRHAQWKEKQYARAVRRERWDRFEMKKIMVRQASMQQKKLERLEFDPALVVPSLEHVPDF